MNINEAKNILNNSGYILTDKSVSLNENDYGPLDKIYTGLANKEAYHDIIGSVRGQIYDGIGEDTGRTGKIFNYYFKPLIDYYDVHSTSENGEFVIKGNYMSDINGIELLVNCIWRIASIERKDRRTTNKNIEYEYLDNASWPDICKLCGALTKIRKNDGQSEPWSDEKRAKYEAIKKAEEEKQKAKEEKRKAEEEAKKKAEEEQKQKELEAKKEKEKIVATYPTEDKDKQRAKDAFRRCNGNIDRYYRELAKQLNKITDSAKWKRRIAAFYQFAKDLPEYSWTNYSSISNRSIIRSYLDTMVTKF